ncbi:hypothetical protein BH11MYX1_BH11MYX1_50160 [soil metagenome]
MTDRTAKGRVTEVMGRTMRVALDSGRVLELELEWGVALWTAGWRVIVVFPATGPPAVELDLSSIGLTIEQAEHFELITARFAELIAGRPVSADQFDAFEASLAVNSFGTRSKDARRFRALLDRTRRGDELPLGPEDPWAVIARTALSTIADREAWVALLGAEGDGSKPTKKWNTQASKWLAVIGVPAFVGTVQTWFAGVVRRPVVRDAANWFTPAMADANSAALRNLVWACALIDPEHERATEQLAVAVGNLAVRCFTKIPGVGALSTKAGNACIYVLSQLPGMRSVSQLSRLGARIRYTKALELIEKAKLECAKRVGVEPIDLEELALPTFGLDVTGRARTQLGAYTIELAITGEDATLAYFNGAKKLKSVPATLKTEHGEELDELKATHKELAALVPTLRYRLERWLVAPRSWSLADLQARYLDHPLAAHLARRLIYVAGDATVMLFDGYPIAATGTQIELAAEVKLSLWHPLGRPESERADWRAFGASLELAQPIKQLERELYVVAPEDHERRSAARFADRVVRQHRLAALCRERGWAYRLQGGFDGANSPTKSLRAYKLEVQLEVRGAGDETVSEAGIYLDVVIGDVTFYRDGHAVALGEVPARCFSETMRDVDLFAST